MLDSQPVDIVQEFNTMQVELVRVDDAFHFEALGKSGVAQHIDGAVDIGGHNAGARPMEMLLMGLAGCSAIDVILILQKQKQVIEDFRLKVDGLREKDAIPAPFKKIHITYLLVCRKTAGQRSGLPCQFFIRGPCAFAPFLQRESKVSAHNRIQAHSLTFTFLSAN